MMGGVSMLISPQASNASVRQADNTDSFYFDGPQNTSNQGNPVQLNYGEEILVGSQIVSSSITIDQLLGKFFEHGSVQEKEIAPPDCGSGRQKELRLKPYTS